MPYTAGVYVKVGVIGVVCDEEGCVVAVMDGDEEVLKGESSRARGGRIEEWQ